MRILIVNKFLYPNGGSETYIFKIGQQLQKMGHEVEYFGMEHEGRIVGNSTGAYTSDMSFHGGSRVSKLLYPFKILYSFEARRRIRQVLDDFKPEVVHLNNINFQITPSIIDEIRKFEAENIHKLSSRSNLSSGSKSQNCEKPFSGASGSRLANSDNASSGASGRIRIVYTAHDYQWVCPNHMLMIPSTGKLCTKCIDGDYGNCSRNRCIHDSRLRSFLGTLEARLYDSRRTYSKVDTVIAPSLFMKNKLSHNRNIAGNRIIVLHNFADKIEGIAGDKVSAEQRNGGKSRYVLYFGRYDVQKGVKTLLNACRELPDIQFVFAGRGDLKADIDAVGNITDQGFVSGKDLAELIAGAEFTVFPSEWYENCPFSVIESQMYGTPVIGSNLGGTPELIRKGISGEIFEAGNEAELKSHIRRLYDDKDLLKMYADKCLEQNGGMDTLEEYCIRLMDIYQGKRQES